VNGSTKQPLVGQRNLNGGVQISHMERLRRDAVFSHIFVDTCSNFLRLRTTAGEMQPYSRLSCLVSTFYGTLDCYFFIYSAYRLQHEINHFCFIIS